MSEDNFSMTAGADEELLSITIRPDSTRQGLGKQLMQEVLTGAARRNAEQIFLEVRESNLGAIRLYEQMGFKMVGMRKNYYLIPSDMITRRPAAREHALLMSLTVENSKP